MKLMFGLILLRRGSRLTQSPTICLISYNIFPEEGNPTTKSFWPVSLHKKTSNAASKVVTKLQSALIPTFFNAFIIVSSKGKSRR